MPPENQDPKPDQTGIQRTEDGTIKDQLPKEPPPPKGEDEDPILGGKEGEEEGDEEILGEGKDKPKEGEEAPSGAPETYTAFTLPEGYEENTEQMDEARALFKKHGLSQEAAQELVDFYGKASKHAGDALTQQWQDTQKEWRGEIKNDPSLGPRLKEVRANFSKMLSVLTVDDDGKPIAGAGKMVTDFREALTLTGIASNPAFVRVIDKLSQYFVEGSHVKGNGPTKPSQTPPGKDARPDMAHALYPTLP